MQLNGYETLLECYETTADAIGWSFRPGNRDNYEGPERSNPERARDLMDKFEPLFRESDREISRDQCGRDHHD